MERTKSLSKSTKESKSVSKNKRGPKSDCTEQVCQLAYKFCLLGATNEKLALLFGKSVSTIEKWIKKYARFRQAVEQGRDIANAEVADSLYQKALGYEHEAVKFFKMRRTKKEYDADGNVIAEHSWDEIHREHYMKKYAPDTKAALKWLAVRERELWGEASTIRHKHDHTFGGDVEVRHVLEQIGDPEDFSIEELKLAAKLGLSRASEEQIHNN